MTQSCSLKALPLFIASLLCALVLFTEVDLIPFFRKSVAPGDMLPSAVPSDQSPKNSSGPGGDDGDRNGATMARCQLNGSVRDLKGFAQLKPHIQNFLFYRHCRHFRLLLDAPGKCGWAAGGSSGIFLLLAIKTMPGSYDRRAVLRQTWAAERQEGGASVRRVFLAGTAGEPGSELRRRTDELLRVESRRHGDILQWDLQDSFFNLTVKQLLFLDWLRDRCPDTRFILNGDDDVFANTDNMVRYLRALDTPGRRPPHLYVGQVLRGTRPVRWPGSKYHIPPQVYEPATFPPYCTGGGFLISGYTAQAVYNMSASVTLIPIDDAYIGMCLEKAGLQPGEHLGFLVVGTNVDPKLVYDMDPCLYRDLFVVHSFQTYEILVMWERIHDPALKCAMPNLS